MEGCEQWKTRSRLRPTQSLPQLTTIVVVQIVNFKEKVVYLCPKKMGC